MTKPNLLWTIYERPNPLQYVARLSLIDGDEPHEHLMVSTYLETIRTELMGRGLHRLSRDPRDDPAIVEIWLGFQEGQPDASIDQRSGEGRH